MTKRIWKVLAPVAIGGMLLGFGGCLGGGVWRAVVSDAALAAAYEFVWDNDAVFDLFPEDAGTGTQFDDRFAAAPSRAEPQGAAPGNLGEGG